MRGYTGSVFIQHQMLRK